MRQRHKAHCLIFTLGVKASNVKATVRSLLNGWCWALVRQGCVKFNFKVALITVSTDVGVSSKADEVVAGIFEANRASRCQRCCGGNWKVHVIHSKRTEQVAVRAVAIIVYM